MSRTYRKNEKVFPLSRKEYERKIRARAKCHFSIGTRWNWHSVRNREELMDEETFIQDDVDWYMSHYDRGHRDGSSETGRNTAFKNMCKKEIRAKSRMEIQKYYKEGHEDYRIFDKKDGKKFIWSVW